MGGYFKVVLKIILKNLSKEKWPKWCKVLKLQRKELAQKQRQAEK